MPRATASVASVLSDLARALRALGVRWYVFGAQALVLRGLPRATADLDVTILWPRSDSRRLVAALRKAGFALRFGDAAFVAATRVLPFVHRSSSLPVDVVLAGPGLEEVFAEASTTVRVGRTRVPVASATHLVVMKALAGRPKDLEDVVALLRGCTAEIDDEEVDRLSAEIAAALSDDDVLRHVREARRRAHR